MATSVVGVGENPTLDSQSPDSSSAEERSDEHCAPKGGRVRPTLLFHQGLAPLPKVQAITVPTRGDTEMTHFETSIQGALARLPGPYRGRGHAVARARRLNDELTAWAKENLGQ